MSDSEDSSDPDAVVIDRDDVSHYNPDNILPKSTDEIKKIREWLELTSYSVAGGEFRKHLTSHAPGTGQWLTSTDEYRQWLQGEELGLLWVKGIPGSGKSVHVANLIDDLYKTNPGCPVLFFFFRQIIAANHNPHALFRDWLEQVLRYSPPLQHQLWTYIEDGVSLGSLSTDDLLKDLQIAFRGLPDRVFCVAGALDEMDTGNDAFLRVIGSLGQWKPAKVKVLISSRPVPRVEIPLRQTPALHIRLEERLVDVDISTYVNSALSESHIPRSEWDVIANAVPGRAYGLFLYAKLAMEAFLEPGVDIKTVLAHLPADLNVLYTELLQEHARRSSISPSVQHLILQSVTHARKPLRLLELAEMCRVIDPVGTGRDLRAMKDLVRTACGPLLEILPDETVSVVHHSFTEYLKGSTRPEHEGGYPVLRPGPAHAQLALSCLRYLLVTRCLDEIQITIDDSDTKPGFGDENCQYPNSTFVSEAVLELRMKFPFFVYASRNWHAHIRSSEAVSYEQDEINEALEQFLSVDKNIKAWLEVSWPGYGTNARMFTALHLAGRYGLVAYTRKLVAGWSGDLNACDITGKTPLWWAAYEGHAATVRELIAGGADPDHRDGLSGRKPLHEAASKNHHAVVRVLLDAGVDPLTPEGLTDRDIASEKVSDGSGKPAIAHSCEHGHVETVDVFLPYIDLEAIHNSRVVTHILAQPGVEVEAMVYGSTSLFKACLARDLATVEVLLEAGADPECLNEVWVQEFGSFAQKGKKSDGSFARYTCLHALCGVPDLSISSHDWDDDDCYEILTLLIKAGADVNRQMEDGTTALHSAVKVSYYLAWLLVEHGVSTQGVDSKGQTPLHYSQVPACIPLLVEEGGADINARDVHGDTPLLAALGEYGNEYKVLLLLECGADARVLNSAGESTLHVALKSYYATPNIVQALLESGVEPDRRNRKDETALILSSRSNDAEKIRNILLSAGADINAQDRTGRTIFWHEIQQLSKARSNVEGKELCNPIQVLLDHGSLPHLRDYRGRTCLHEAIKMQMVGSASDDKKDTPSFDFLLGIGLDHTIVDHDGNTLLHELAAREGSTVAYGRKWVFSLWERLVDTLGLDVDQQNHSGRTPLHVLCDAYPQGAQRYVEGPEPIEFLIKRMKNFDVKDHDGVTALHIASTRTEYYTEKLLKAGLDARATTHEDLTPLHLAARAQESNIVGMLVRSLRESSRRKSRADLDTPLSNDNGDRSKIAGIDAQDGNGLTPLYYAIRSGRIETVSILLEAGANVHICGYVFKACSEFEEEDALRNATCHTKLDPLTRREIRVDVSNTHEECYLNKSPSTEFSTGDSRRLEEIVKLLVSYGADTSGLGPSKHSSDRGVIGDCVWQGKAYTASCLVDQVPHSLWVEPGKSAPFSRFLAVSAPAYDPSLAKSERFPPVEARKPNTYSFSLFLRQRQYQLVKELAKRGTRFLPDPRERYHSSHFALLVQHGFALLVRRIGEIEAERALGQGDWHAFSDSSKAGLWCANRPENENQSEGRVVHHYTSDRELPNLAVVRPLVEDFHVDVNERAWGSECIGDGRQLAYNESALHYYLLKVPGIDINLRVKGGLTPLHVAIGGRNTAFKPRPHAYDSVKRLLKAGADIHAVTRRGESCLSLAKHNDRIVQLLIKHGAKVSSDDVVSAVEAGKVEVLRELLNATDDDGKRLDFDLDPALRAAGMLFGKPQPDDGIWSPSVDNVVIIEIIGILIDHGANPLSNYFILIQEESDDYDYRPSRKRICFNKGASTLDENAKYYEMTLLHGLLGVTDFQIQPFLVSGIDVNYKNPNGLTVLHAACASGNLVTRPFDTHNSTTDGRPQETIFQRLVALGADLGTRDDRGRTILVSLLNSFSWTTSPERRATLEDIITLAPELVHEADLDGDTPLMYAVRRAVDSAADTETIHRLLTAGASPLVTNKYGQSVLHMLARDLGTAGLRELFRDFVSRETPLFRFARRFPQDPDDRYDRDYTKRELRGDEYEVPREQGAIALLKELGADFFAKDNKGKGLLHVAASGDVVRFQELMAAGLDPMMENNMQQTAIDIAAASCNNTDLEIFEKKARR
ncbi:ankyrin repeat-containing domain protein [Dactylonectria estremocensis]|uniref:Ankyrin repeat-containing domain protein n=1 Tax=Dactylonectria estremocensis TaxID=1079267 RepID=A0A9P9DU37_9HYPO|nr:ankyrin repeat-containing domain protein [Dactylonectria estremocensis]